MGPLDPPQIRLGDRVVARHDMDIVGKVVQVTDGDPYGHVGVQLDSSPDGSPAQFDPAYLLVVLDLRTH